MLLTVYLEMFDYCEPLNQARIQRGGGGGRVIGFLSNTGPDPLVNHKATKPAFNAGPLSARQRNAI